VRKEPRLAGLLAEAKRLAAEHNAALKAEDAARQEKNERLASERAERRKAQIDAWVAEHGDENQQARHAVRLLPEDEVLYGMRADAFAALNEFPRYAKLTKAEVYSEFGIEVYSGEDDYAPKVEFSAADATSATAEEFATLQMIQHATTIGRIAKLNPRATLREHTGEVDDYGKVSRKSVLVELTVGEFTFSREYACP
jgi:hypothetical protein